MLDEIRTLIDHKEAPGNLDRALALLAALKAERPSDDLVRGKMSHAWFYKGYLAPAGSKERERAFDHGKTCGLEAITLAPRSAYGNFWYGSNLGMLGICKGVMASLRSIDPMRKTMEVVLQEDEGFFFAGPHRALAQLYHQAPGWPISIGNKTTAGEHYERALELAPGFFHNRLLVAQYYLDVGRKAQAREHLDWLLAAPVNPDHAIEDGDYRRQAEKLQQRYF
ncbi:MAG TPA: TRAP transporter TatT component family protein [Polyangia bacterium]|jgi:tetratricopeptide (TPR) repeat protein